MRILFNTAGGKTRKKELGLGHIFRCMNLANELKPNKVYFQIEDFGHVKNLIQKNGYKDIFLNSKNSNITNDVNRTLKIIKKYKIDVLIIDKFTVKKKFPKIMKSYIKTIVISDLDRIDYNADLIVNGFIGYENKTMRNRHNVKCLLGPRYQILNKNFRKKTASRKKYTILATFGGLDDRNIFSIFCKVIKNYLDKISIKIILGPETKKSSQLRILEKKFTKNLEVINQTDDMKTEIAKAKFGICSGGITSYEFACMCVPFAIICQYPHQRKTALEWQRKGIAKNFGFNDKQIAKKIEKYLEEIIINKVSFTKSNIINGNGAQLVAREILKFKNIN